MKKLNYFQFGVILLSGFFCALLLLGNVSLLLGMKGAPSSAPVKTSVATDYSTIAKESAVAPSQQALSDIATAKRQYTSADKTVQDAENPGGFTDVQRQTIATFKNKEGQTGGLVEVRKEQIKALLGSKTQAADPTKSPLTQSPNQTASLINRTPAQITPPQQGLTPNRLGIALQPSNLSPQPFAKSGQLLNQGKIPTMQESNSNPQELSQASFNITNRSPDAQAIPKMLQLQAEDQSSLNEIQTSSQTTKLDPMSLKSADTLSDLNTTDKSQNLPRLATADENTQTTEESNSGVQEKTTTATTLEINKYTRQYFPEGGEERGVVSQQGFISPPGSDADVSTGLLNTGNTYLAPAQRTITGQTATGAANLQTPSIAGSATGPAGQRAGGLTIQSNQASIEKAENGGNIAAQQGKLESSEIAGSTAASSSTSGQDTLKAISIDDPQPSKLPPTDQQKIIPSKPKPFITPLKLPAREDEPAPNVPPKKDDNNNKTFMAIGGVAALGALVGGLVGGLTAGGDNQGGGGSSAAANAPGAPGQVVSVTPGPGQAPAENIFPSGAGTTDQQPAPTPAPVVVAPVGAQKPKGFHDQADEIGLLNEIAR